MDETATESTDAAPPATPNAPARGPNITLDDRLRLIEALLSDDAKEKLAKSQECLNRQEIDARNSVLAVEDYFETVSRKFNDPTYIPTLCTYPDLHVELTNARQLPLGDYRTTRDKVKEKYGEMKNHLHGMILKYERSGNGGMQRSDDSDDWGTFNLEEVTDGDDRSMFLPKNDQNLFYLLYYWQRLDEEGKVAFTLAKLPNWMKANAGQFALCSNPNKRSGNEKALSQLSGSIGAVGHSIAVHAVASLGRNIDKYQTQLFAVQAKMIDMDESSPVYKLYQARQEHIERCIEKAQADEDDAWKCLKTCDS